MNKLYGSVTDTTKIESISVQENHDSATSIATVNTYKDTTGLALGDDITINLGYVGDYDRVFKGYVKKIDRANPDGMVTISSQDVMARAIDYFVVSSSPDTKYTAQNIKAEDLIEDVLRMAGLTKFHLDNTYFTLATNGSTAEVNLIGAYDYCKSISDLLAWNLWAEDDGYIYLKNRKPFITDGSLHQPGEIIDISIYTIPLSEIFSISLTSNEKDLRNRIVIYGGNGLTGEKKRATSYDPVLGSYVHVLPTTPSQYYKAVCLSSLIITDQNFADDACQYNLELLNRVQYELNLTVEGKDFYHARRAVTIEYAPLGITGLWYIFGCEHSFTKAGYLCNLTLRK